MKRSEELPNSPALTSSAKRAMKPRPTGERSPPREISIPRPSSPRERLPTSSTSARPRATSSTTAGCVGLSRRSKRNTLPLSAVGGASPRTAISPAASARSSRTSRSSAARADSMSSSPPAASSASGAVIRRGALRLSLSRAVVLLVGRPPTVTSSILRYVATTSVPSMEPSSVGA
eukprot:1192603-Prymnesium_polylepis.2